MVAAGTVEQLQALADDPPARARVIPLQVAGAFHTEHMAPAVDHVRGAAAEIAPADPAVPEHAPAVLRLPIVPTGTM